jgi:2-polyprenyl-3-methyl-5-hydroxy-6-metoxy-1,4-benzoquinol methylase
MDPNNTGWDKLEKKPNFMLFQHRDQLLEHAPFDVILAYDVFDHMSSDEDAQENMVFLAKLLKKGGQMKVRFHPWTSRHATHSYRTFNKAFAHLVLKKEQLIVSGHSYSDCLKITEPVLTYDRWMKAAGLKTINSNVVKEPLEDYFKQPHIAHVIKQNWKNSKFKVFASGEQLPAFQMEMQFLDYLLTHQSVVTM